MTSECRTLSRSVVKRCVAPEPCALPWLGDAHGLPWSCVVVFSQFNRSDSHVVFLNGNILGCHSSPHFFAQQCRHLRRVGLLGEFVSVYVHDGLKEVHLCSDAGRCCRPLILVDPYTREPRINVRAACRVWRRVAVWRGTHHVRHHIVPRRNTCVTCRLASATSIRCLPRTVWSTSM